MQLRKRYIHLGTVPEEMTNNFKALIVEDDWYRLDYRKGMFNLEKEEDLYNSLVIRHSKTYETKTIQNMPLYEKYEPVLQPYLDWLSQYFYIEDWVAFAARLKPGGVVEMHKDNSEFLSTIHRVHFPIETNPNAKYQVETEEIHMPLHSVYEIDNVRMHGVTNHGDEARIHLIINIYGHPIANLDNYFITED